MKNSKYLQHFRVLLEVITRQWASYQIRKYCRLRLFQKCRERFPRHQLKRKPLFSDPGMHDGTCVTYVPWCVWVKRSRHSRRVRHPRFYVSGRRPIELRYTREFNNTAYNKFSPVPRTYHAWYPTFSILFPVIIIFCNVHRQVITIWFEKAHSNYLQPIVCELWTSHHVIDRLE